MSNNLFNKAALALLALFTLAACDKNKEPKHPPLSWGETECYNDFLWKKYIPDTLTRTLVFDFNEDARQFMDRPAVIGVFKKTDAERYEPVTPQEAQLFLNGSPCDANQVIISSKMPESRLGVVFARSAEDKMHYWYFKVIDNGGLDRINDLELAGKDSSQELLMEFQVEKSKVWNPLARASALIGSLLLALLLIWMLFLRPMFYPTFKVGKLSLRDPAPFISTHRLRGCRQMVLTDKKEKQGLLSRFFTSRITYNVNALWTSRVVIMPSDRKSVKIRITNEYSIEARTLKVNQEYTLVNNKTKTRTIIIIS